MSLRLRLSLLFSSLVGGVLLIFGALVYGFVSLILITQVDGSLSDTAQQVIESLKVDSTNQVDPRSLLNFTTSGNIVFQVWNSDQTLQLARPPSLQSPLDESGLQSNQSLYTSNSLGNFHLRVLSIPIQSERGSVGILQLAQNLALLDATQRTLATVLVLLAVPAILLSSLAAWVAIGRALEPLSTMAQIASHITRADDLQYRIPLSGTRPDDEVGILIRVFNQTLERLENLFNTQRRFLTDVSHELRTPLTVIKGNISLIKKLKQADEESLAVIDSEVDRLTRLVGNLLLLAQAESGRLPLSRKNVELDTVLLEVFQQMRLVAGERVKITLTEIDQVHITGDRDRLKQVLLNLVSNAIYYTPAGGEVCLGLRKQEKFAEVIIKDTGPGISAEDKEHIFERFYRGEKSRKRSQDSGFGLGLSIAYWIVKNHGGMIEVESELGKGSTFTVFLPYQPPEEIEVKNSQL